MEKILIIQDIKDAVFTLKNNHVPPTISGDYSIFTPIRIVKPNNKCKVKRRKAQLRKLHCNIVFIVK